MAYSTSNPPVLISQDIGGSNKTWRYNSTDAASAVDADGYFSNGKSLGMKVGDLVIVTDTDASPPVVTTHRVVSVSTTDQSVDVSNGDTTVTGTDSD